MNESIDYLFSINTGRSGSHYMSSVLEHVENCQAFHEPDPKGNGIVMHQFAQGNSSPMRRLAQDKAQQIRAIKDNGHHYAETNHCFIKGFGWYMPELLGETNIGIIILKRPAAQIADSYIRKHTSPLRQQGREWITSPTKKNPLVKPPILFLTPRISMVVGRLIKNLIRPFRKDAHKASVLPEWLVNYEKACIEWYVHETNAETERFRKKFPNIRYYEVEISELNSMENVNKMLDFFGWKAMGSMASVVGKATNQKIPKTAK